jgi:hypothetical protein
MDATIALMQAENCATLAVQVVSAAVLTLQSLGLGVVPFDRHEL